MFYANCAVALSSAAQMFYYDYYPGYQLITVGFNALVMLAILGIYGRRL